MLLDLQLAEGSELALPKSIQRDPVRGVIEHLDLILVRRGERITVDVPVNLSGTIASGGLLEQSLTTLSVTAEATHIPSGVDLSIEGLEVGTAVHAGDVELPSGVELVGEADQLVLHVVAAPTAEQLEAEGAGEVAEGEAPEEAAAEGEAPADGEAPAEGGSEEPSAE